MKTIRLSDERGLGNHDWLISRHSFSFADYHDPAHMGFRSLRVINEDHIRGGNGFGAHSHRDMEIITYVVSGALTHQDSMGNKAVIVPGEVQYMSAGAGVTHSEVNDSKHQEAHILQIWIIPQQPGGKPSYGQKSFASEIEDKKLVLVVSPDQREGSIGIKQSADMYISRLSTGEDFDFKIRPGRGIWIQMVKGAAEISGQKLDVGDALAIENETELKVIATDNCELIMFDLA